MALKNSISHIRKEKKQLPLSSNASPQELQNSTVQYSILVYQYEDFKSINDIIFTRDANADVPTGLCMLSVPFCLVSLVVLY